MDAAIVTAALRTATLIGGDVDSAVAPYARDALDALLMWVKQAFGVEVQYSVTVPVPLAPDDDEWYTVFRIPQYGVSWNSQDPSSFREAINALSLLLEE